MYYKYFLLKYINFKLYFEILEPYKLIEDMINSEFNHA